MNNENELRLMDLLPEEIEELSSIAVKLNLPIHNQMHLSELLDLISTTAKEEC